MIIDTDNNYDISIVSNNSIKITILWNEWMNDAFIERFFIAYCFTHKALYNHVGWGGVGTLLNHHQCVASTWTMPRLPQDNGASALTTHQLQVERESLSQLSGCAHHTPATGGERVIELIKWMGIIKRPWLIRASGGNLARTPGLHPYSLREVPWDY